MSAAECAHIRAALDAGVGVEHVDFLRLLAEQRRSHGLGLAPQPRPRGSSIWQDRGVTSRIRVVVRKRPLNKKELAKEEEDIVTMERDVSEPSGGEAGESQSRSQLSAGQLTLWEPRQKVDLTQYTEKHEFAFDDVYPTEVSNDEIYTSTVHPLIGTIFNRCKVTCFAYGQTGSGKT